MSGFQPSKQSAGMIPHPCKMGLKYIGLTALMPRAGKRTGSRNPNANSANGSE